MIGIVIFLLGGILGWYAHKAQIKIGGTIEHMRGLILCVLHNSPPLGVKEILPLVIAWSADEGDTVLASEKLVAFVAEGMVSQKLCTRSADGKYTLTAIAVQSIVASKRWNAAQQQLHSQLKTQIGDQ